MVLNIIKSCYDFYGRSVIPRNNILSISDSTCELREKKVLDFFVVNLINIIDMFAKYPRYLEDEVMNQDHFVKTAESALIPIPIPKAVRIFWLI